jgi:hypothetical protein
MMGRHETHASPAQQRIANLMPLGGLADAAVRRGSAWQRLSSKKTRHSQAHSRSLRAGTARAGQVWQSIWHGRVASGKNWAGRGQNVWNWRPSRRARRQRRSEAEGCYLTGLMSAWQCDGPRRRFASEC